MLIHFASSPCEHFAHTSRGGFWVGNFTSRISLREFTSPLYLSRSVRTERDSLREFTSRVSPSITYVHTEDNHTRESFARSLSVCGDPYPTPRVEALRKSAEIPQKSGGKNGTPRGPDAARKPVAARYIGGRGQ